MSFCSSYLQSWEEAKEAKHLFSGLQLFFDSELQLVYQCHDRAHISKIVESLDKEVDGTKIGINIDLL